jgi:ABC-type multidrug transport system fused ATPase/permease subunit
VTEQQEPQSHGRTEALPPASRGARRGWLLRAALEAGLIALSLVGALAINEWKESRDRRDRMQEALASIRAEIGENITSFTERVALNEELMARLRQLAAAKQPYEHSALLSPTRTAPSSIAWESARSAGITNGMPFDLLVALGRAYGAYVDYSGEMAFFSQQLYSNVGGIGSTAREFRERPDQLAGYYNDLTGRARRVKTRFEEALKVIDATRLE